MLALDKGECRDNYHNSEQETPQESHVIGIACEYIKDSDEEYYHRDYEATH